MYPIIDKRKTGIHLRRLMEERDLTVRDVQQYLGLGSVQSVYHWLNGISMPTVDNLYALSELFQLPMDEIVRGNRRREVVGLEDRRRRRLQAYYAALQELRAA